MTLRTFSYGGGTIERFWSKVVRRGPDECWPWQGKPNKKGYGRFGVDRRVVLAHRFAFEVTHGTLLADECACHTCDNPICCNPAHLFRGTRAINNKDMWAKGRGKITHQRSRTSFSPELFADIGHPRAKLSQSQVDAIRSARQAGKVYREIAEMFAISIAQAAKICTGGSWR